MSLTISLRRRRLPAISARRVCGCFWIFFEQRPGLRKGLPEKEPTLEFLQAFDPAQDILLGFFSEPGQGNQPVFVTGVFQLPQGAEAQSVDQFLHFFWAEPRDAEHIPDALGEGFF